MTILKLADLPYAYDALAPYMSAETLEYHHDKHHKAYVDNGNALLEKSPLNGKSLVEIVKGSFGKEQGLFNNAAQHWNHENFWNWMTGKNGGGDKLPALVQKHIDDSFGGYNAFREKFIDAGKTQFGSGWAWLSFCPDNGVLEITKTANGENPLIKDCKPILGCDVWEHSYYIDYRNARPKYLETFVDKLINWEYVEAMLEKAIKS